MTGFSGLQFTLVFNWNFVMLLGFFMTHSLMSKFDTFKASLSAKLLQNNFALGLALVVPIKRLRDY